MSSFPSRDTDPYRAIDSKTYYYQTARLEADHPAQNDVSNRVATTGWVQSIVSGATLAPTVTKFTDLQIQVSPGSITTMGGQICTLADTSEPLGVDRSYSDEFLHTEYVWIRFNDCGLVVTEDAPKNDEGSLLAVIEVNTTTIENIVNITKPLNWLPSVDPYLDGTPRTKNPPLNYESDNVVNTGWLNKELLGYNCPILKVEDLNNITWSEGILYVGSLRFTINAGSYTFNTTQNNLFYVVLNSSSTTNNTLTVIPYTSLTNATLKVIYRIYVSAGNILATAIGNSAI